VDKQSRVIKAYIKSKINKTSWEIDAKYKELEKRIVFVSNETNSLRDKLFLIEQLVMINSFLDQGKDEVGKLTDIIHTAQQGKIHASVLELEKNLREIKITLPTGATLPTGISSREAVEIIKMSDITIYFRDDSIVYVLKIPIVKDKDLTLYKLLPAPIKLDNQLNYAYIKPDVDYLAISINKEFFTVYNDHSLKSCKQALGFRLCKQRQISFIKNKLLNCGMALILKPNVLSSNCEVKYCKISNSIS